MVWCRMVWHGVYDCMVWCGMVRFVMVVAKHAWIVWRDGAIESSSHEMRNE